MMASGRVGPTTVIMGGPRVRRAAVGALAVLAAVAAAPLVGTLAGPVQADESPLIGRLSTSDVAARTVLVPVPDGVVPRRLAGTVRVTSGPGVEPRGTLEVLVDGEVVETLPAAPRSAPRVQVRRADVRADGFLEVGLRWTRGCAASGVTADLQDLRLVHGGLEDAPTSEAEFLGPAATRIDVVVPRKAGDDVLEAALESVALLTDHYGPDVPVLMHPVDTVLPRTGAGQRVLRLEPGPTPSRGLEQRFGLWTLTLKGPGASLSNLVRDALGPAPEVPAPASTLSLDDLDVPTSLGGWGTSSTRVPLPQDRLGGSLDGIDVHLEGSHTAVPPGTLARLDVRLDGALLESVDVAASEGSGLELDLSIPAERLRAGSALEVVLTAVPDGGCAEIGSTLPLELDLDPDLSTVTAGRGDSGTTGFQRLPASLGGELDVAIRTQGQGRADAASDAGLLVAALQRAAGLPLDLTLVTPEELVSGERPGLLVGADVTDTLAVQAPVQLDAEVPALAADEPFAALQAVTHRGRDLVLLGTSVSEGADVTDEERVALARELAESTLSSGWGALEGGAVVQGDAGRPVTVAATAPVDPAGEQEDEGNPYAPYFLGAAGLLVLAVLVQVGLVIRKDRRLRQSRPDRP